MAWNTIADKILIMLPGVSARLVAVQLHQGCISLFPPALPTTSSCLGLGCCLGSLAIPRNTSIAMLCMLNPGR